MGNSAIVVDDCAFPFLDRCAFFFPCENHSLPFPSKKTAFELKAVTIA